MLAEEMENYCGNCGRPIEETTGKCQHCGAPLSVTLVTINKKEREWRNPDDYLIGRKGWINAQFLKQWIPKYNEWLLTTKQKSPRELSSDERRKTREEYKQFIEERKQQLEKWTVPKEEPEKPRKIIETLSDEEFKKIVITELKELNRTLKRLADSLERRKQVSSS